MFDAVSVLQDRTVSGTEWTAGATEMMVKGDRGGGEWGSEGTARPFVPWFVGGES
jgi:hypothetical protein